MADAAAKACLSRFESMQAERLDFDRRWQRVSDYILPGRDFTTTRAPNLIRPRRVTSSVPANAMRRMAAFVLAYLVDFTRPFLLPNVARGLVAAGYDTDLDPASQDYLGGLEWQVFSHLMLPKAGLMLRLGSGCQDLCAFGNMVLWTGRRRGFGPYFMTRPFQACWFAENAEGVIDTLYFRMQMPIYRICEKWPNALSIEGWEEKARKAEQGDQAQVLHCVEPRPGGRHGAVREAKPFASRVVVVEKETVIDESGYDSFPYAVGRYNPMPGQTYALGPGWDVMPDVMALNNFQQALEEATELRAAPPLAVPARMFGKSLDRRPRAVNAYNAMGVGLNSPDKAILKLDLAGDITAPTAYIQYLTGLIESGFFVDWQRLPDNGQMTATEVNDRRDIRLRGMASIVANLEPMMTSLGDRAMEVMVAEGILPTPPSALAGKEVDWEYAGPLQIAQLRGNAQAALQLMNARGLAAGQDPTAGGTVDLEECLRVLAESLGAPTRLLNSRQEVAEQKAALALQQKQQQDAEKAATLASAARDGASAVASATGAANDAQDAADARSAPGGPAAPFAPVAPFAQPIAA